jgi:hypothetical protein
MDTTKTEKMFALVVQWKASGKTQKEFCERFSLNQATLAYWVAKKKRSDQTAGGFALVDLTDVSHPGGRWRSSIPMGYDF